MKQEEVNIEVVSIDDLIQDDHNFNKGNEQGAQLLERSFRECGAGRSVLIDKDNRLVGGNKAQKGFKAAGKKKVIIVDSDADTLVAVRRKDVSLDSAEGRKMAYLDNLTTQVNLTWDQTELEAVQADVEGFDIADFGFDIEDLPQVTFPTGEKQGEGEGKPQTEVKEDDFDPDAHYETKVKAGEVWQLGEHRLMCGDSTDADAVAKLMNGERADLVFTDPPYGMKKESEGVLNDNLNFDDLLEFNKRWIPLTFANLKDNGSWYCWGIDEPLMDIYSNILRPMQKRNEITFRNLITWDKKTGQGQNSQDFRMYAIADEKCLFVMRGIQDFSIEYNEMWKPVRDWMIEQESRSGLTRKQINEVLGVASTGGGMATHYFGKQVGQYSIPTEAMYNKLRDYCYLRGIDAFQRDYKSLSDEYESIKSAWYKSRAYFDNTHDNMNNVWHFDRTSAEEREGLDHATPKPLALCARGIKTSSREGEIVLDVFGGSGSTMIACEQLGRKCRMMELDPHYCTVIIARWEKLTGQKAVKQ